MKVWLRENNIQFSDHLHRLVLYKLIKEHRDKIVYNSVNIASKYGHKLLYLPPYHCELNPIEGVWSIVKTETAKNGPYTNTLELRNELLKNFGKVSSKSLVGLWRKSLNYSDSYMDNINNASIMDDDLSSNCSEGTDLEFED